MNRRLVWAVFLTIMVFGGSVARASPITYYFAGTFDFAYAPYAAYLNTAFSGELIYDPTWSSVSSGTYSSTYAVPAGALTLSLVDVNVVSTGGSMNVEDGPGMEVMVLWGPISVTPTSGSPPAASQFGLNLLCTSGNCSTTALTSTALPSTLPELEALGNPFFHYQPTSITSGAQGRLDCFTSDPGGCGGTSVPDPASSLLLLGIGLAGLTAWRRQ